MNPIKTEVLKFAPSKLFSPLNLPYAGQFLPDIESEKFLGLQLDRQISLKNHVSFLIKKLSSAYCVMRQLNHVLTFYSLKLIHFAHFQSVIIVIIIASTACGGPWPS